MGAAVAGEELVLREDLGALAAGDVGGAVLRVGVDDEGLVHEWDALGHPLVQGAHLVHDLADRVGYVAGGQDQADGAARLPLEPSQLRKVRECFMLVRSVLEPLRGVLGREAPLMLSHAG
nr:hypothetical protein [Rubrobacter marinus]